jgi:hypothetical protein
MMDVKQLLAERNVEYKYAVYLATPRFTGLDFSTVQHQGLPWQIILPTLARRVAACRHHAPPVMRALEQATAAYYTLIEQYTDYVLKKAEKMQLEKTARTFSKGSSYNEWCVQAQKREIEITQKADEIAHLRQKHQDSKAQFTVVTTGVLEALRRPRMRVEAQQRHWCRRFFASKMSPELALANDLQAFLEAVCQADNWPSGRVLRDGLVEDATIVQTALACDWREQTGLQQCSRSGAGSSVSLLGK